MAQLAMLARLPGRLATRRLLSTSTAGPIEVYKSMVASGQFREDNHQVAAMLHLDRLYNDLLAYEPTPPKKPPPPKGGKEWKGPQFDAYGQPIGGGAAYTGVDKGGAAGAGFSADGDMFAGLRSLFGGGDDAKKKDDPSAEPSLDGLEKVPLGVYMYGGVGVGKSLLMDTFFDVAPIDKGKKRRIHFHEFMLEVHRRMHELRQSNPDMGDPIPYIAYDISVVTQLLCFDEFQVTDVADALVMRRLFRYLFAHGLVMVATSNRKPNDLYLNGIQRDSFLPFIDDLQLRCYSHDLASGTDYRTINAVDASGGTYMYPLDDSTRSRVDSLFKRLAKDDPLPGGKAAGPQTLRLRGRELKVPAAGNAVARFTFSELCGRPLGAEDYLGIATAYHTVVVEEVPALSLNEINQVRRLITMVDAFYDQHVRLILTAAVAEDELFIPNRNTSKAAAGKKGKAGDALGSQGLEQHGDLLGTSKYVPSSQDEVFAFDRTLSRLREMRSHAYLVRAASAGSGGHALFNENRVPVLLYQTGTAISQKEAAELFTSYDVDASGALEKPEVRLLLQDLSERRRGHRNVTEEELEHAWATMDVDGNGEVSSHEFSAFITSDSLGNVSLVPSRFGNANEESKSLGRAGSRRAKGVNADAL